MAATPQSATFVFVGQSGQTYHVDAYVSDVAAANVRFDSGAGSGAATNTFWMPPENVTLTDVSIVTGTADTTRMRLVVNGRPLTSILRYVLHVSTNPYRPALRIGFAKGSQVTAIQLA
jgi:hypothetical protein